MQKRIALKEVKKSNCAVYIVSVDGLPFDIFEQKADGEKMIKWLRKNIYNIPDSWYMFRFFVGSNDIDCEWDFLQFLFWLKDKESPVSKTLSDLIAKGEEKLKILEKEEQDYFEEIGLDIEYNL